MYLCPSAYKLYIHALLDLQADETETATTSAATSASTPASAAASSSDVASTADPASTPTTVSTADTASPSITVSVPTTASMLTNPATCQTPTSHVGGIQPDPQPGASSRGHKRKRAAESDASGVLLTATGALDQLVCRLDQRAGAPPPPPSHIDLFFQSLAAQFKLIPARQQPSAMLQLQTIVSENAGVDEYNGDVLAYEQL